MPWSPLSRTKFMTRFISSTSPPAVPSLKFTYTEIIVDGTVSQQFCSTL